MSEPTDRSPATDLLTDLDQNPEMAAVLQSRIVPPEVLALPQTIAEIAAIVKVTAERQDRIAAAQERAAQRQDHTDAQIAELRASVNDFVAKQETANTHFETFIKEQREMNSQLKENNERITVALADFKAVAEGQFTRINHLYGNISNLTGPLVEQLGADLLPEALLDINVNLEHTVILRCQRKKDGDTLTAINDALRAGRISPKERKDLLEADIIAQATDIQTNETFHFVAEVSRTLFATDLDKAEARAKIYSTALGITAHKDTIANQVAAIDNFKEAIADRDQNIATANRTINDQQRQINLLLTPEPTSTPLPNYTPYPTATRRPRPTPRPTYTPHPTPTPITAFQTNYHGIRCQSAPDFTTKSEIPTVGDTVHIYTGVQIRANGNSGRGYITTHNGHDWVITAAHVVDNHQQVQVEGISFTVHSRYPDKDVAFIYLGKAQTTGDGWHRFCMGRKSADPSTLATTT